MSVAVSSAFTLSGTHSMGVLLIPAPLSIEIKSRFLPWVRFLPLIFVQKSCFKQSDSKPFTNMLSPNANSESGLTWS